MARTVPAGLLLVAFGALVTASLSGAISLGVCCADDAYIAHAARNLAAGLGYASTLQQRQEDFGLEPFDPSITTGPTLVLPAAAAIALVGPRHWVPGVVAIVAWSGLLALLWWMVRGRIASSERVDLAGAVFLGLVYASFVWHFEQWFALLGEVTAALLVGIGAVLWAVRPATRARIVAAGVLVGLATLTKLIAVISAAPVVAMLLLSGRRSSRLTTRLRRVALYGAGVALPLALFELWKLIAVGLAGYVRMYRQMLWMIAEQAAVQPVRISLLERSRQYLDGFQARLGFSPVEMVALGAVAAAIVLASRRPRVYRLAAVLLGTVLVHGFWWLFFSNGWPRYLLIAVVLYLGLLVLPLLALRSPRTRCLWLALLVLSTFPNWSRLGFPLQRVAGEGWFRPSSSVVNALQVAELLDRQPEDVRIVGQWWATVADLEYLSAHPGRFDQYQAVTPEDRSRGFVIAVNRRFVGAQDGAFAELVDTCRPVFDKAPYLVLECGH